MRYCEGRSRPNRFNSWILLYVLIKEARDVAGVWSAAHIKASQRSCCDGLSYSCTFVNISSILLNILKFLKVLNLCVNQSVTTLHRTSCCNKNSQNLPSEVLDVCFCRYIPKYTFSWLVTPMWLIISKCFVFPSFRVWYLW